MLRGTFSCVHCTYLLNQAVVVLGHRPLFAIRCSNNNALYQSYGDSAVSIDLPLSAVTNSSVVELTGVTVSR